MRDAALPRIFRLSYLRYAPWAGAWEMHGGHSPASVENQRQGSVEERSGATAHE
jgi:hypothetical protein